MRQRSLFVLCLCTSNLSTLIILKLCNLGSKLKGKNWLWTACVHVDVALYLSTALILLIKCRKLHLLDTCFPLMVIVLSQKEFQTLYLNPKFVKTLFRAYILQKFCRPFEAISHFTILYSSLLMHRGIFQSITIACKMQSSATVEVFSALQQNRNCQWILNSIMIQYPPMALLLEPVIKAYHYIIFIIFTVICTSTQTGVGVGFSMFKNQLFRNSILGTFGPFNFRNETSGEKSGNHCGVNRSYDSKPY